MIQHNNDKVVSADLDALKLLMLDTIYPVGSIYMSVNNVSPSNLFGGSWEAIQDRFLLAAGASYSGGITGGSATHTPSGTLSGGAVGNHTLIVAEMPAHRHQEYYTWNGAGSVGGNWKVNMTSTGNGGVGTWTHTSGLTDVALTGGGGAHNHPFTQPKFTGTSQNTLPPYLTVYIWKWVD